MIRNYLLLLFPLCLSITVSSQVQQTDEIIALQKKINKKEEKLLKKYDLVAEEDYVIHSLGKEIDPDTFQIDLYMANRDAYFRALAMKRKRELLTQVRALQTTIDLSKAHTLEEYDAILDKIPSPIVPLSRGQAKADSAELSMLYYQMQEELSKAKNEKQERNIRTKYRTEYQLPPEYFLTEKELEAYNLKKLKQEQLALQQQAVEARKILRVKAEEFKRQALEMDQQDP